jgi:hypothetical protein
MNTKEIIAYVRAPGPAKNQNDVVEALIGDATALITARRCISVEAKRSCYMEQDTKFRSAFNKAKSEMEAMGWNEDSLLNHFKSRPDMREIIAPSVVKSQPRSSSRNEIHNFLFDNMRDQLKRVQQYDNAVDNLATHMIRLFDSAMEFSMEHELSAGLNVSDHYEIATKTVLVECGGMMLSAVSTTEDRVDTARIFSKAVKKARITKPEILEMFEDHLQVLGFLVKRVKGFAGDVVKDAT